MDIILLKENLMANWYVFFIIIQHEQWSLTNSLFLAIYSLLVSSKSSLVYQLQARPNLVYGQ